VVARTVTPPSPTVEAKSRGLVLQSDLAPVQLHPIEKIVGKLDALLVLKDDESKVFLLFGLPVLWYGHSFQRPSVQEQLIQNLFGDLFIEPTTPQGSQLLLVRLFSMGST
jgi:alpha-ketoglutarate-dependent taurine dioxygenase